MVFFLVRVLFVPKGEFKSQHIHDSQAMKERGIHCVMDQDKDCLLYTSDAADE